MYLSSKHKTFPITFSFFHISQHSLLLIPSHFRHYVLWPPVHMSMSGFQSPFSLLVLLYISFYQLCVVHISIPLDYKSMSYSPVIPNLTIICWINKQKILHISECLFETLKIQIFYSVLSLQPSFPFILLCN